MKKKYTILILAALLASALAISACSTSEQPEQENSPESESTTASVDDPAPEEKTDAPDSSAPQQEETVTASQDNTELLWTETPVDMTMYVASDAVSSFSAALDIGEKLTDYRLNDKLRVVAHTDTGYYKLENGEFIHEEFLSETEITDGGFISSVDATIYTTTPAKE